MNADIDSTDSSEIHLDNQDQPRPGLLPYFQVKIENEDQHLVLYFEQQESEENLPISELSNQLKSATYQYFKIDEEKVNQIINEQDLKTDHAYLVGEIDGSKVFTQIRFKLDENKKLFAILEDSPKTHDLSPDAIRMELTRLGYERFYYGANAIPGISRAAQSGERGEYELGEKRNAEASITFDDDLMTAYITLSPPFGGREMDQELLKFALKNAEVDSRACDKSILTQVLNEQKAEGLAFAKGREPVNGNDAEFTPLVEQTQTVKPKESKSGKIDTKEVLEFTIVDPETPLMKRTPATEGISGYNVKGQAIPAIDGVDLPYNSELPGTRISEEDDSILLSSTKGHPVILKDGVKVDKTLVVNNVALSTGHVTFDGSLLVRGEVMPGMKINVTGDIIVEGVVTNAIMRAKNNITVKCGVVGADPENKDDPEYTCILKAGGDIQAQYISQTKINAGHDILVKEYISYCHSEAKHKVMAGGEGTGKGRIFGGECYGQAGVEAKSIGADGGIKTFITAGTPQSQQSQYKQLLETQKHKTEQLAKLEFMFNKRMLKIKENPTDQDLLGKTQAIKKIIDELKREVAKLNAAVDQIEIFFKKSRKAEVKIYKSTFPNVLISINGAQFNLRQEGKGGNFVKSGKDIRWENIH